MLDPSVDDHGIVGAARRRRGRLRVVISLVALVGFMAFEIAIGFMSDQPDDVLPGFTSLGSTRSALLFLGLALCCALIISSIASRLVTAAEIRAVERLATRIEAPDATNLSVRRKTAWWALVVRGQTFGVTSAIVGLAGERLVIHGAVRVVMTMLAVAIGLVCIVVGVYAAADLPKVLGKRRTLARIDASGVMLARGMVTIPWTVIEAVAWNAFGYAIRLRPGAEPPSFADPTLSDKALKRLRRNEVLKAEEGVMTILAGGTTPAPEVVLAIAMRQITHADSSMV